MRTRTLKNEQTRTILTAMIVSDEVLGTLFNSLGPEARPFPDRWSNLIASWCLKHYAKIQKAPRRDIQMIYNRWAARADDEESTKLLVKRLLKQLSNYTQLAREMNAPYIIDTAQAYFRTVQMQRMIASVEENLDQGSVEDAEKAIKEDLVSVNREQWQKLSPQLVKDLLDVEKSEQLIKWRGALSEFMEDQFCRDSFIAFAGPEKSGKSFWLQEVVYQAMLQKRRVAYYMVGDLSEKQMLRRLFSRIARQPFWGGLVHYPTAMRMRDDEVQVRTEERSFEKINKKTMRAAFETLQQRTASKDLRLRFKTFVAGSMAASDIELDLLQELRLGSGAPDVVVIDYADILAPEPSTARQDFRHQINGTWTKLRAISQNFHCSVVTATQTAASSYSRDLMRKEDFSEDKRKASHVTGMLGINQTPEEKKRQLYRLNWLFLREGMWSSYEAIHVACCLGIANPAVISKLF